jgi:CheY-like chemotaxis protein/HPt (histidine-containing phosphotransfer) domain-containing protein
MHPENNQQDDAGTARILVVEDNSVNRKLAVALVQKWGFIALVACDGREALTILDRERVDLVLMDVQMPVMDGLGATRAIRGQEAESGGHLPIIALTAHAYASDRAKCIDAGMDEVVTKPLDHQVLYETILRLLPEGDEGDSGAVASAASADLMAPAGAATTSHTPQFDRQDAMGRVDGDIQLLEEIAILFLDSCEEWLADLRRGLADSDAAVIERVAHTLKGSAASIGARPLVEAALRVEGIGASLDLAEADAAVRDLESRFEKLAEELRSFLEERAS